MSIRLYADEFRVSIYEEAPGGGDPLDPNSQMNRPVLDPVTWIDNIYFHSDLDYYSTVQYVPSVTISHSAVSSPANAVTPFVTFLGQIGTTNHLLVTHSLGYVPRFFVVYDDKMIPHGTPVQTGGGGARFVTGYATTTQIRLHELYVSGSSALSAINVNYGVMVFKESAADPLLDKLLIEPGNVIFGQGKFNLEWPHLRAVEPGESPFAQALGKTAAIGNGGVRVWPPNGTALDFFNYSGSFTTPPSFVNLGLGL